MNGNKIPHHFYCEIVYGDDDLIIAMNKQFGLDYCLKKDDLFSPLSLMDVANVNRLDFVVEKAIYSLVDGCVFVRGLCKVHKLDDYLLRIVEVLKLEGWNMSVHTFKSSDFRKSNAVSAFEKLAKEVLTRLSEETL